MRKIFLTLAIALIAYSTHAQTNTFPLIGNVGVGTTNPQTNLHIIGLGASIDGGDIQMVGGGLIIQGNTGSRSATTGAQLEFAIPALTDGTGAWGQARIITIAANSNNSDATGKMILGTRRAFNKLGTGSRWYYGNDITIDGNGSVGIGTTDPKGYKLAVAGSAIAESVTVKLQGSWPDYVFKPSYNLRPLCEVKSYINKNSHLPEMPSEIEVAKNGINLGEIVKMQTRKIEELTLYLIEKDKQVADQQLENKQQDQRITVLEKALLSLTAK